MISVTEALQIITAQTKPLPTEEVDLLQSTGRILAQPITADRDFPPFDRATMDGVAIGSRAFGQDVRQFRITDMQPAGHPQKQLTNRGNCIEIMTGAMLPIGADVVIRYEDLTITNGIAYVNLNEVTPYQNVHLQGSDKKAGELLVEAGVKITPAIVAIMASVGMATVPVYRLPKVVVCSTGDELVPVTQQPLPHQIRQSNSYMLLAGLQQECIIADKYHLPDEPEAMAEQMAKMVEEYDVLLFSGAVSKGKFDFLPQVLQQLGMQTLFHSIAQKPGKPLLFGKFNDGALVFGFPGNPVSTWVCYQLYFKAWLYRSLNIKLPLQQAALSKDIKFKPPLTHHVLVRLTNHNGQLIATPVDTSTSGDMVNLMQAEGFISLPTDQEHFAEGSVFDVQLF
ncbi:molybdopterin molybdotransferase MoeA [Mucilaginibacter galii]|uniref:Molybdopterin molybdenumtransferase n=1 Tax=Mucilaginibacter galii TaxID=2005073 RepID=A0A917JE01_9SPHI|nr:molybdopterin molybdotransferase MoeA [Mucilaginibacter galii]GGI51974.1 molybdopterin molybdenumtransferase MoeA [Mucilaginibacter galii]